jgi:hypothetical protein
MLDLAQHLITSTDLATIHSSSINLANILHFNVADIHPHINMDLIAQQFKQDMMGDATKSWNNFVRSGQIWALLIGVAVGYLFRSITNS